MLNWGILGLGKISHKFVNDLQLLPDHQIAGVGSRSLDKALAFGHQYSVKNCYGSYAELLSDKNIDIVYISTPHHVHADWTIKALNAGKHVLCEKPLGINHKEVQAMIAASKANNKLLMEALWSRFIPAVNEVINRSKSGALGPINYIKADFTMSRTDPPESRLLDINLAGGSLLDMGIYPVFLAYAMMGVPEKILATANFHATGADLQTAIILKYESGVASLMSGFRSQSDMVASIHGPEGRLVLETTWHETESYHEVIAGVKRNFSHPKLGKGYTHEIQEAKKCIDNGLIESPVWSHQNSLDLITILDQIRAEIGLSYPSENNSIT